MKIFTLLILFLSVFILFGSANLTPDHRSFDFGEIFEKDGKVEHEFTFKNTGDEPLLIIDVHAS